MTKSLIAEDRLPCWRLLSISPTSSDSVMLRSPEISFMPFQNASSRLTLVLWPATTIERLTTGDFMMRPPRRCDVDRAVRWHGVRALHRWCAQPCFGRIAHDWPQPLSLIALP